MLLMLDAAQAALGSRVPLRASLGVLSDVLLTPSGVTACDFWVPSKCLEVEQASASSVISPKS
jgi:hypothetical protein